MKGKPPLTLFLLQTVCFIFPAHQEQELSQVPPLQRKEREKLSPG